MVGYRRLYGALLVEADRSSRHICCDYDVPEPAGGGTGRT